MGSETDVAAALRPDQRCDGVARIDYSSACVRAGEAGSLEECADFVALEALIALQEESYYPGDHCCGDRGAGDVVVAATWG